MKVKEGPNNIPIAFKEIGVPIFRCVAIGHFEYPVKNKDETRNQGCHLVFQCPICRTIHLHGGKYGEIGGGDGPRSAHCNCWPRGYFLKEVDRMDAVLIKPFTKPSSDYWR